MKVIALLLIIVSVSTMEILLQEQTTCYDIIIQQPSWSKLFTFHCDQKISNVNLVFYDQQAKKIAETGVGLNYQSFLQVSYKQAGGHKFCFLKENTTPMYVHFDVIDLHVETKVGKQDIQKTTNRIAEFLVDIRKIGWQLKELIMSHNQVKQQVKQSNSTAFNLTMAKTFIMMVILGIQLFIVRKIYD